MSILPVDCLIFDDSGVFRRVNNDNCVFFFVLNGLSVLSCFLYFYFYFKIPNYQNSSNSLVFFLFLSQSLLNFSYFFLFGFFCFVKPNDYSFSLKLLSMLNPLLLFFVYFWLSCIAHNLYVLCHNYIVNIEKKILCYKYQLIIYLSILYLLTLFNLSFPSFPLLNKNFNFLKAYEKNYVTFFFLLGIGIIFYTLSRTFTVTKKNLEVLNLNFFFREKDEENIKKIFYLLMIRRLVVISYFLVVYVPPNIFMVLNYAFSFETSENYYLKFASVLLMSLNGLFIFLVKMTEPLMRKILVNFLTFNRDFFDNLKRLNRGRGNKNSIHLPNSESLLMDSDNSFSGDEDYYNDKYIDTVKKYIQHVSAMDYGKSVINIISNDTNKEIFSRSVYTNEKTRRFNTAKNILTLDGRYKFKEGVSRKTSYNNINRIGNNIFQIKNVNRRLSTPFEIKNVDNVDNVNNVNNKPTNYIELNDLKKNKNEEEMKDLSTKMKLKKYKSEAIGGRGSLYSITSEDEGEEENVNEEGKDNNDKDRKEDNDLTSKYKLMHSFNLYNKIINVKCVQSQLHFKRREKKFGIVRIVEEDEIEKLKEKLKNFEKKKRKNSFHKKISSIVKLRSGSIVNHHNDDDDGYNSPSSPSLSPIRKKVSSARRRRRRHAADDDDETKKRNRTCVKQKSEPIHALSFFKQEIGGFDAINFHLASSDSILTFLAISICVYNSREIRKKIGNINPDLHRYSRKNILNNNNNNNNIYNNKCEEAPPLAALFAPDYPLPWPPSMYRETSALREYDEFSVPKTLMNSFSPPSRLSLKVMEYAPSVFLHLRQSDGVGEERVMLSLNVGLNINKISELRLSGGRGDNTMFSTWDNNYVVKSINRQEKDLFVNSMLPDYHTLLLSTRSLLARIYGVYSVEINDKGVRYVILQKNMSILPKDRKVLTFDLKGSTVDRQCIKQSDAAFVSSSSDPQKAKEEIGKKYKKVVLKDIDLKILGFEFGLNKYDAQSLLNSINSDTSFLQRFKVTDYSLLVFVFRFSKELYNKFCVFSGVYKGEKEKWLYSFSIIDFLGTFDLEKKCEKIAKEIVGFIRLLKDTNFSVADPITYCSRFREYCCKVIGNEKSNDI